MVTYLNVFSPRMKDGVLGQFDGGLIVTAYRYRISVLEIRLACRAGMCERNGSAGRHSEFG
jgi:hypothetical protein